MNKYLIVGFKTDEARDTALTRINSDHDVFMFAKCDDTDDLQYQIEELKEDYE